MIAWYYEPYCSFYELRIFIDFRFQIFDLDIVCNVSIPLPRLTSEARDVAALRLILDTCYLLSPPLYF